MQVIVGNGANPNSDISEPGVLAVFCIGVAGLGLLRRRRRV
ncbi:MAG: PEP-CTERM sorting domain-containing protein [Alphaproteobacteria bacterium]